MISLNPPCRHTCLRSPPRKYLQQSHYGCLLNIYNQLIIKGSNLLSRVLVAVFLYLLGRPFVPSSFVRSCPCFGFPALVVSLSIPHCSSSSPSSLLVRVSSGILAVVVVQTLKELIEQESAIGLYRDKECKVRRVRPSHFPTHPRAVLALLGVCCRVLASIWSAR